MISLAHDVAAAFHIRHRQFRRYPSVRQSSLPNRLNDTPTLVVEVATLMFDAGRKSVLVIQVEETLMKDSETMLVDPPAALRLEVNVAVVAAEPVPCPQNNKRDFLLVAVAVPVAVDCLHIAVAVVVVGIPTIVAEATLFAEVDRTHCTPAPSLDAACHTGALVLPSLPFYPLVQQAQPSSTSLVSESSRAYFHY
jgi:hypothetical protein